MKEIAWFVIVSSVAALFTSCAGSPEPSPVSMTEAVDRPEWMTRIPSEEGYFFGIGTSGDLDEAKQMSIIDAGRQFSTQVKSVFLENVRESDGNIETMVTRMDEQLTDQVVYGVKFVDQYQDVNGNQWVLSRAPLSCILDVAEGFLLSYRLEMKEAAMEKVVRAIDREVEEKTFGRVLWTVEDRFGVVSLDGMTLDEVNVPGSVLFWDFNESREGWQVSTGQATNVTQYKDRNVLRIQLRAGSDMVVLRSDSFPPMDFSGLTMEIRFWGPSSWPEEAEIQYTAFDETNKWRGSETAPDAGAPEPGKWNVQRYSFSPATRGEGDIGNTVGLNLEFVNWDRIGDNAVIIDYIRMYER